MAQKVEGGIGHAPSVRSFEAIDAVEEDSEQCDAAADAQDRVDERLRAADRLMLAPTHVEGQAAEREEETQAGQATQTSVQPQRHRATPANDILLVTRLSAVCKKRK